MEYRIRERQRKEKVHVGDSPVKLNEKKSERELEQEMKTKETFFVGVRTT